MANILITGGAGYIGSVISNLALQQGHSVKVVDILLFKQDVPLVHMVNPSYSFVRADICKIDSLAAIFKGVDFIVHAAAIVGEPASKKLPRLTESINYDASIKLIKIASQFSVKGFIFLSTCSNYGISDGFATEESPLQPLSLYARTKVDVERYLLDNRGLDWNICRLSTVYGVSPRMRFDLTVNDFTLRALRNKQLDIFLPFTYRPYIHVFDVARVIMKLINDFARVKNNIFNIGFSRENYQKISIAEEIKKIIPELVIKVTEKGADLRDYRVDFSKMEKILNLKNIYVVRDGIAQVLQVLQLGLIRDAEDGVYYNTQPQMDILNGISV